MNTNEKIHIMGDFIKSGQNSKVKKMIEQGIDIHHADDYFLYLAVYAKNKELQEYFIDIGLDPEVTKGRLAVAHPEGLAYLRNYKHEKEIRENAEKLDQSLPKKDYIKAKKKI